LDFKMGGSPEIMRPISGEHKRSLKLFWNLKRQVARENRSVFEFQIGQVTNKINFRNPKRLLKFFFNLKGQVTRKNRLGWVCVGRSPMKTDQGECVWEGPRRK
jgi:hypothetical protein